MKDSNKSSRRRLLGMGAALSGSLLAGENTPGQLGIPLGPFVGLYGMSGMFAYNLLASIRLLANVTRALADKAVAGFKVNAAQLAEALERNPILITALNPVIGYEKGAAIVKRAYAEGRPIREVAAEMTDLPREELARLLDPHELTRGGIKGRGEGG